MSHFQSLLLGIMQGLTEFLPVSSSGHLVILEHLLRMPADARLALAAVLHLGTAAALVVFFRRELAGLATGFFARDDGRRRSSRSMVGYVVAGSIPAGVVGLLAGDRLEALFARPLLVGPMLLVTGALLLATRFAPDRGRSVAWPAAVVIGLAQAVAILPGISRSGATIAAALLLGIDRREGFEFSFILSVPVVLAAAVKELVGLDWHLLGVTAVGTGVAVAFAAGLLALAVLRRAVVGRGLFWFGFYCLAAGVSALVFLR